MNPNPLPVQFWLLGQDAQRGDLRLRGFDYRCNPHGKGSGIYRLGNLWMQAAAIWLEQEGGCLVYFRPKEGFYIAPLGYLSPNTPAGSRQDFAPSLASLLPHLQEHERWIAARYGPDHRRLQLRGLPHSAKRHLASWQQLLQVAKAPMLSLPRALEHTMEGHAKP